VTQNTDLSGWASFQPLLSGRVLQLAFVGPEPDPVVFDGLLVHDHGQALLGSLLIGQSTSELGAQLKGVSHDDVTFFDTQGAVLGTTLVAAPGQWRGLALDPSLRNRVTPTNVVEIPVTTSGPMMELLVPWTSPPDSLGYLGVLASSANLQADTDRLRLLMAIVSGLGVLLTLLLGIMLARLITRPVHTLLEATRLVSAGDLAHRAPVTSRDEIGELTESFNAMTENLQTKSASLKEAMSRLEGTYLMTMEALAAAVEARDPYTHGHTERVGSYARVLAEALGLQPAEIEALQRACILHDIGKIGVEDLILNKQARLDADEELRMQRHPLIAVEMLKGIDFLEPVLPIIRHHHERWDGNGYPDQLHADEIPLGARILAVADAMDAMTSDRSYRRARTFEHAKAEILKGSGTHFDPEVVTAFIKSQDAIEQLLNESAESNDQPHPEPGDLRGWRLHVVGH
jgi:putative nucleotidyltransferase with HDIG domain